jgi:hypothetical protein
MTHVSIAELRKHCTDVIGDPRKTETEHYPMAELPDEWKVGDDGDPAQNWVAAVRRQRESG